MTLKRVLIDLLSAEQLREFCTAFEIEADRRSADAMLDGRETDHRNQGLDR